MSHQETEKTEPVDPRLGKLRQACKDSCWIFAQTVEPHRVYGPCHQELFEWWQLCEMEGIQNT